MKSRELKFGHVILRSESRLFQLCPVGEKLSGEIGHFLHFFFPFFSCNISVHSCKTFNPHLSRAAQAANSLKLVVLGSFQDMRTFVHKSVAPLLLLNMKIRQIHSGNIYLFLVLPMLEVPKSHTNTSHKSRGTERQCCLIIYLSSHARRLPSEDWSSHFQQKSDYNLINRNLNV